MQPAAGELYEEIPFSHCETKYSCTMLGHVGVNTITHNVCANSILHELSIPTYLCTIAQFK